MGVVLNYYARLECAVRVWFGDDPGTYDLLTPGYAGEKHQVVDSMAFKAFHFHVHCVFPLLVLRGIGGILVLDRIFDDMFLFPQGPRAFTAAGGENRGNVRANMLFAAGSNDPAAYLACDSPLADTSKLNSSSSLTVSASFSSMMRLFRATRNGADHLWPGRRH